MDNQNDTPTSKLFCAGCQDFTDHTSYTDHNGEHVFVCSACERAIKLPAGISPEDAVDYFTKHTLHNQGQVSLEGEIKLHDDILSALGNTSFEGVKPQEVTEITPETENAEVVETEQVQPEMENTDQENSEVQSQEEQSE